MEELLSIIKGPDFPTAATILGTRGIEEAYRTGRGKIKVRAVTDIETMPNGKSHIIVTELPYLVNKARLIGKDGGAGKDEEDRRHHGHHRRIQPGGLKDQHRAEERRQRKCDLKSSS